LLPLFFTDMADTEVPLFRKSDLLVDIILCGGFFVILFTMLQSHVPSNDPTMIYLWSAGTAGCMTGVFWLASWMFRVVLRYQRELNARN